MQCHDEMLYALRAGNGEASEVLYDIEVVGNPDLDPVFWSNSTSPDPQVANVRLSVPVRCSIQIPSLTTK